MEAVRAEFKKVRAKRRIEITPERVKAYLKKLKINKYDHANAICNLLNGVPAPDLPPDLEAQLKSMFLETQEPFRRHRPKGRKNFLSYAYTLHKFCELLGEDQYLPHFQLLKSSEKLFKQDQIWKKICDELRWEFIPSV